MGPEEALRAKYPAQVIIPSHRVYTCELCGSRFDQIENFARFRVFGDGDSVVVYVCMDQDVCQYRMAVRPTAPES